MVVTLLLTSCQTTKEIKLDFPDFPTLENPEDLVEYPDYWIVQKPYFEKLTTYIVDSEKIYDELKLFDKDTIIK